MGGGGDLRRAGGGELLDDAHEVGVLKARDEERPAVRAPLVGADLVALVVAEAPAGGPLQGLDIELDLLAEESVDGPAELASSALSWTCSV